MPSNAFNLPDLGNIEPNDPLRNAFGSYLANVIRKKGFEGQTHDIDYRIGAKNLRAKTTIGDAILSAIINYDGNAQINLQKPLYDGNLDISATRNNGGNAYRIGYQKSFW